VAILLAASVPVISSIAEADTAMTVASPGPLTDAVDFITDLPSCGGVGPTGVLDEGSSFLVSDYCNATTYRYNTTGASPSLVTSVANGITHAMVDHNGVLYGVASNNQNITPSGVWELSRSTLALTRQIAQSPCGDIRDLANDPAGGGLILTGDCGIYRIRGMDTPSPFVELIASGNFDGISVDAATNTAWVALAGADAIGHYALASGNLLETVPVPGDPDGIAVAAPGAPNGIGGNLFVNNNDGTLVMIDVHNGNARSVVASGGTRGDFVTVGKDGFLYLTQTDEIVQIKPAIFIPANPEATALDPRQWAAGDVHVHSAGDTSLRDNLYCRNTVPPLIPRDGKPTDEQERACAQYLMAMVADRMKAPAENGGVKPLPLSWAILSEHGPWLGINSPGKTRITDYDTAEGRKEWNIIADQATATAKAEHLRMLIGEELGTTGTTGHFSAYSIPDYVRNGPLNPVESTYVRDVRRDGGWGAINHPFEGSTWDCWTCFGQYPGTIRAMEIITSATLPRTELLRRWDQELISGVPLAAVGGGDTHTVGRTPANFSNNIHGHTAQQRGGNTAALGSDGRARTYVYTGVRAVAPTFSSRDPSDPVRQALYNGSSLASNGPLAVMTLDGAAPATAGTRWRASHTVKVAWNHGDGYGDPISVKIVVGQRKDPAIAMDPWCNADLYDAPRRNQCRVEKTFTLSASDRTAGQFSTTINQAGYTSLSPVARPTRHNPSAYIRLEVEFPRVNNARRVVYGSPFYIDGTA
jgi:hypothetical protein